MTDQRERAKITAEIPAWLEGQIATETARLVRDHVLAVTENMVREAVAEAIDKAVESITEARIEAEVVALLAEGWARTNAYGEETGKRVTLRERVRGILEKRDYGHRQALVEIIEDATKAAVREELREELDAARAKFRAAVDEELIGKFRELLRKTVGIDL